MTGGERAIPHPDDVGALLVLLLDGAITLGDLDRFAADNSLAAREAKHRYLALYQVGRDAHGAVLS